MPSRFVRDAAVSCSQNGVNNSRVGGTCPSDPHDIDQYLKSVDAEMDSTTQKAQGTTQKTLNTTQKKILNYLKEHPHATRKDMAVVIGDITEDGIKFNIGKLQQSGLLKREGGRKSGTWVVIDNNH